MTQFEITTSTELSGGGICSMRPLRKRAFSAPASIRLRSAQREHLVGHVQAVDEAIGSDPAGGQEDVDAATRAEVEDGVSGV
jgi:hypothetical protein